MNCSGNSREADSITATTTGSTTKPASGVAGSWTDCHPSQCLSKSRVNPNLDRSGHGMVPRLERGSSNHRWLARVEKRFSRGTMAARLHLLCVQRPHSGAGTFRVNSDVRTSATDSALFEAKRVPQNCGRCCTRAGAAKQGQQSRVGVPQLGAKCSRSVSESVGFDHVEIAARFLHNVSRAEFRKNADPARGRNIGLAPT
jgi:hypothetical protein